MMLASGGNHAKGKKTSKEVAKMPSETSKTKGKKGKGKNSTVNEGTRQRHEVAIIPSKPPEGFLPFSHDVITPELVEHAAKNLNETEETRKKGIEELRAILKSDPDLVLTDEDHLLLIFLRSRKFDAKRAAELLKLGLYYVESYRYLLERKDPAIIRRVINANMVGFLQYRDRKGRAVIYARADAWDPNVISAADAIFGGIIAVQHAGLNPVTQVAGFVVVLDLKELTIQQVLAMSRWMIFGTITLQRACPCFMKAFHVINVPPIYKIGWKLVKPLLSEKIRNRFIFHKSSDLSSLYEHVPKEILPPELGGSVPFSNDHWAYDIDNIEQMYYDHLNKNYSISRRKKASSN